MADLKLTVQEQLVLHGVQQGGSYKSTIQGINDVYKRVITIPTTSSATLATFKSSVATGSVNAMDLDNVQYIRVTNLNTTNYVDLSLQMEAGNDDSAADYGTTLRLNPKTTFLMGNPSSSLSTSDNSPSIITPTANLESLIAKTSSSVQLEIFIAST